MKATGMRPIAVEITAADLTPSAPTYVSVGATSAAAVAANSTRKGLIITNTNDTNFVSLAFGANAAVLYSGVTLAPYGTWEMTTMSFTTLVVNAIASAAGTNISVQEFST